MIEFYGSKESVKKQLENFMKGVSNVEHIGLMYGILNEIKKRKGYDFKYLKEELDKKLNLIKKFNYN